MNLLIKSVACAVLVALVGCAAKPPTIGVAEREELTVDPEVLYSMTVTELFEDWIRQPDGTSILQIQFAIQAHADADLAWKVSWFDANGMTVESVGKGYKKASVLVGQTRYFKATAPHPQVASYQLHLREPQ